MKLKVVVGVALALLAVRGWAAYELVRDGVPQATVVLAADAADQLKGAVDCLVKSVETAAGRPRCGGP